MLCYCALEPSDGWSESAKIHFIKLIYSFVIKLSVLFSFLSCIMITWLALCLVALHSTFFEKGGIGLVQ